MPGYVSKENWAKNVQFTVRELVSPVGVRNDRLKLICDAVAEAARYGRHVRGLGSLFSFTDVVATTDWAIDPDGLQAVLEVTSAAGGWAGPLGAALSPGAKQRKAYVHLESGLRVHAALAALKAHGLAIITMGSSSGQRFAGVLSTGTHGGDFDLAPIADWVRAIQLVDSTGMLHWIERDAERLTRDAAAAQTLAGPGARIHFDDPLFEAALVAVGTFGFITDVVLEVREPYALSEKFDQMTWSQIRPLMASGAIFNAPPNGPHANAPPGATYRTLEVHLNPFRLPGGNDRTAWVVTRMEAPGNGAGTWQRPSSNVDKLALWLDVEVGGADQYRRQIDALIKANRDTTGNFYPSEQVADTGTGDPLPVMSMEIALTTAGNRHLQLIDAMLDVFDRRTQMPTPELFSGFPAIRFTRPSRAMLAMQADGGPNDRFCHIEIAGLQKIDNPVSPDPNHLEGRNAEIMDEIARIAVSLGARLHWGQATFPDVGFPTGTYARLGQFLQQRARLPGAATARFDNDATLWAGLGVLPQGFESAAGAPLTSRSWAPDDVAPLFQQAPVPLVLPDGRASLYFVNGDGRVATSNFLLQDGWQAWVAVPMTDWTRYVTQPVAPASNSDLHPELLARFDDGSLRHAWRGPSGWSDFKGLSDAGKFADLAPACLADAEGFLHVFAVGTDGQLQHCRQRRDWGIIGWNGFGPLAARGAAIASAPSVVRRPDGKLEVFTRDALGKIAVLAQQFPTSDSAWLPWQDTGLVSTAAQAVAVAPDGTTAVAVIDGAKRLHVSLRSAGQAAFGPKVALAAPLGDGSPPALLAVGSTFWVAARAANELLVMTFAGGAFGPVQRLGVGQASAPCLLRLTDGHVAVAIKVAHDVVVYRRVS